MAGNTVNYTIKVGVLGDAQLQKFQRDVDKLNRNAAQSAKSLRNMSTSMSKLGAVAKIASTAMAVFYSARGLTSVIKQADAMRNLEASFQTLLGSGGRATAMMDEIFAVAKRTGAPLNDVASATQRLAVGLGEMGASNQQISTIAETFIKLGRVGGASMEDVNGALIQFSQGLASGRLQGDEFRSISERLPLVMRALSKELGVTVGELKQLGSEGKITADVMANAMLNAAKDVDGQFAKLPLTFEQASNNFKTMLTQFARSPAVVATIDALAKALGSITQNVNLFITDMGKLWKSMSDGQKATGLVIAGLAALKVAIVAFSASNPFTLILTAVALAVTGIVANWSAIKNLFLYQLPSWIQQGVAAWHEFRAGTLAALSPLVQNVAEVFDTIGNAILSSMRATMNALWGVISDAAEKIYRNPAFGLLTRDMRDGVIDLMSKADAMANRASQTINTAASAAKSFDAAITSAGDAAKAASDKAAGLSLAGDAMKALSETAGAAGAPGGAIDNFSAGLEGLEDAATKGAGGAKKLSKAAKDLKDDMDKAADSIKSSFGSALEDGIINAAKGGKDAFKNMAESILNDIARMLIQMRVVKPLMDALFPKGGGGPLSWLTGSANGNYFPNGITGRPMTAFATGGIIGGRTRIGSNLLGENGPEAVMPLRRSNGRMGVAAAPVNVNVINNAGAEVKVSESTGNDGSRTIDVMIEQKVRNSFATGAMDKVMKSRFGTSPVGG